MRYLLTAAEMKRCDHNCIHDIGIPGEVLMERAALGAFRFLEEKGLTGKGKSAFVLAGYGNNGGDGLALARLLCDSGTDVEICLPGETKNATESWKLQRRILEHYPVSFGKEPSECAYTIVIDALFGVGLSRPVEGAFAGLLQRCNVLDGFKLALDLPSGIDTDTGEILGTAFVADATVTFGFEKRGLYLYPGKTYSGEVRLCDIGIPLTAFQGEMPKMCYLDEPAEELLPKRDPAGNKGTFGKVLVIGGAFQMAGAAILCANSAYRIGAGMVKVLTAPENREILQRTIPEALLGNMEDPEDTQSGLDWCDVVCIGPGMGNSPRTGGIMELVLKRTDKSLVIDADGLNLLSENPGLLQALKSRGESGAQTVLTPHMGELKRLWEGGGFGTKLSMAELKRTPWETAGVLAGAMGVTVAAKDARTCICQKGSPVVLNLSGNSGMATAGSGDVLSGVIAGLLAQGMSAYDGACTGVRLHGLAGDLAAKEKGEYGMMAGDISQAIAGLRS